MIVLGIDTCGASGSVALGRVRGDGVEILAHAALEGRTYSATLVSAVEGVLKEHGVGLKDVGCLVVVNGPGGFTGVRVGVSTAKGLAEGAGIPVVAVSRLEVLAVKAGVLSAALDAHRQELFLRLGGRELLAGAGELAGLDAPERCAVCDSGSAAILGALWPATWLTIAEAPTAADAIAQAGGQIRRKRFADVALLDGHYLRRSDAEIFGEGTKGLRTKGQAASVGIFPGGAAVDIRAMEAGDLEAVMEIAAALEMAPQWGRAIYEAAVDEEALPRRIALVVEVGGQVVGFAIASVIAPEAELETIVVAAGRERRGLGAALLAGLFRDLGTLGVSEVTLEVRESNAAAQAFYRACGFEEFGRRASYYADTREDAVLMRAAIAVRRKME